MGYNSFRFPGGALRAGCAKRSHIGPDFAAVSVSRPLFKKLSGKCV